MMNNTENSQALTTVSINLAQEAVPDEVDLAPLMAHAFVQGGQAREELFKRDQGSLTGGFGPGGWIAIFPWILKALVKGGPLIYELLTTDVADLASVINDLLDISEKVKRKEKVESLPEDPYRSLRTVINVVSGELKASGLSEDDSDLITFRVMRALLETPEESMVFIQAIEKDKS